MQMASRVLTTPRLTLTPHTLADFPDSAAMWADPAVTRFIGGRPNTPEEAWARVLRHAGLWALLGYGYWAVRETATGHFVGELGFMDVKRDLDPPFGDAPEAGWALCPWAHGKGYATEALVAAHGWLDAARGNPRTVCMIQDGNSASVRVAAKLGYAEYARTAYKCEPTVLYERLPG
jgi:RimJ/RimL family protein N-acetyltransferase